MNPQIHLGICVIKEKMTNPNASHLRLAGEPEAIWSRRSPWCTK
jgi:hypothetical protein